MLLGAYSFRPLQRPGVISTVYGRMFRRFAGQDLHTLPIDDIIVSSKSFEEHLDHVKNVLQRLCAHDVKLKAKKCNFFRKEVCYLGRIVSEGGYRIDPKNVLLISFPVHLFWHIPMSTYRTLYILMLRIKALEQLLALSMSRRPNANCWVRITDTDDG